MHTINSRRITELNIVSRSKEKKKAFQPRGKQILPKIQEALLIKNKTKNLVKGLYKLKPN